MLRVLGLSDFKGAFQDSFTALGFRVPFKAS